MKAIITGATMVALSTAFLSGPADAAGCLRGAVVGGIAGHYAGQHGWLGAGAGCLIGRHYANKHTRQDMNGNQLTGSSINVSQQRRYRASNGY